MSLITQRHGMLWAANNGSGPIPGTYQLRGKTERRGLLPSQYKYYAWHLGELTANAISYLSGNSSAVITPLFNYDARGAAIEGNSNRWAAAIVDIDEGGDILVVDYPDGNALTANTPITIDFSSPLSWSTMTWNGIINNIYQHRAYILLLGAYDNDATPKRFVHWDSAGNDLWFSADTGVNAYVNVSEYTVV